MKKILCTILMVLLVNTESNAQYKSLVSGQYALSETINTFNEKTKQPESLTVIEQLVIEVTRTGELSITPTDLKSKYFTKAKGYITIDGDVQFGFTLIRGKSIFSINYNGVITDDGYVKGTLICIYPTSETALKGEWAMKFINMPKKAM